MNFKNENGITLLALVITIVVMVILASVAISASVGDNGLINQAEEGIIKASIREVEEALDAYILLEEKELIRGGDYSDVTISQLTDIVNTTTAETNTKTITVDDTETEIYYKIYTITGLEELNIKGEYGKGTTTDVFKIEVELESDADSNETRNYEVFYISSAGEEYRK